MKIAEDIANHLYYTVWVLMLLQMGKVIGSTLIQFDFIYILNIIDAAYDCSLILFAIGIIRLGKEVEGLRNWKKSSIILFVAAGIDIISLLLSYIFEMEDWIISPLIFIRLTLLLSYLILLVAVFVMLKFHIDDLFKLNYVNQKGQFYLSSGFCLLIIPYIITWYEDYLFIKLVQNWVANLAFFFFLLASFLVILGYFNLTSSMRMLNQEKILDAQMEQSSEIQDSSNNIIVQKNGEEN